MFCHLVFTEDDAEGPAPGPALLRYKVSSRHQAPGSRLWPGLGLAAALASLQKKPCHHVLALSALWQADPMGHSQQDVFMGFAVVTGSLYDSEGPE